MTLNNVAVRDLVRAMMHDQWVDEGYAAPNTLVYPYQWLWDSCFHTLIWLELGEAERAVTELSSVLSVQAPDGFVPHMNYVRDPDAHRDLWGRSGASSITQPPMFGHAARRLVDAGVDVSDELLDRCARGLRFLLDTRPRHGSGLVALCHPWESGADDSPRWDGACPGGFDLKRWRTFKSGLVGSIVRSEHGSPLSTQAFDVASVGFTALVAFNARELATVVDDDRLLAGADELCDALDARWSDVTHTWVDAGVTEGVSAGVRTLDGLLPVLVERDQVRREVVFEDLVDDDAYGARFGPAGVHRSEATYDPMTYWRGPAWPQLSYLLWVAASHADSDAIAHKIATATLAGASISGLAEYWNPETGQGLGAIPQSWAGLAIVMRNTTGSPA